MDVNWLFPISYSMFQISLRKLSDTFRDFIQSHPNIVVL